MRQVVSYNESCPSCQLPVLSMNVRMHAIQVLHEVSQEHFEETMERLLKERESEANQ